MIFLLFLLALSILVLIAVVQVQKLIINEITNENIGLRQIIDNVKSKY